MNTTHSSHVKQNIYWYCQSRRGLQTALARAWYPGVERMPRNTYFCRWLSDPVDRRAVHLDMVIMLSQVLGISLDHLVMDPDDFERLYRPTGDWDEEQTNVYRRIQEWADNRPAGFWQIDSRVKQQKRKAAAKKRKSKKKAVSRT